MTEKKFSFFLSSVIRHQTSTQISSLYLFTMNSPQIEDFPWYGSLATQHYLGHRGFKTLIEACGSARAVYATSAAGLQAICPTLQPKMLESLAKGPDFKAWETIRLDCERLGISITAPELPEFPQVLKALEAPPPLLFLQGAWREEDAQAVALVGTRAPTDYGRQAAAALARDLCAAGYTVVSGLAIGIDAAAHEGALARAPQGAQIPSGRTLAVIGCGLDVDYPRENAALRARIVQEGRGAVISEHPPGTLPNRMHFPRRNLLISALSRAIVVVEAGEKSGALITADHARRQGRVLFAVPGSIFNPRARGNHALLRAGAALAASAEDVVAVLDGLPGDKAPRSRPVQPALPPQGSPPVASPKRRRTGAEPPGPSDPVLRLWSGDEACGLDALAARAVAENLWPAERAAAALIESLLILEMNGRVERLPGSNYRRRGG